MQTFAEKVMVYTNCPGLTDAITLAGDETELHKSVKFEQKNAPVIDWISSCYAFEKNGRSRDIRVFFFVQQNRQSTFPLRPFTIS
jgi:hypothetical protein